MMMSVKDFAKAYNLSERVVRRLLVASPALPHIRVGRKYSIPRDEAWTWICQNLDRVSAATA